MRPILTLLLAADLCKLRSKYPKICTWPQFLPHSYIAHSSSAVGPQRGQIGKNRVLKMCFSAVVRSIVLGYQFFLKPFFFSKLSSISNGSDLSLQIKKLEKLRLFAKIVFPPSCFQYTSVMIFFQTNFFFEIYAVLQTDPF